MERAAASVTVGVSVIADGFSALFKIAEAGSVSGFSEKLTSFRLVDCRAGGLLGSGPMVADLG